MAAASLKRSLETSVLCRAFKADVNFRYGIKICALSWCFRHWRIHLASPITLYIDLKECANGKTILFLCVGRKFTHDSSSALRLHRRSPQMVQNTSSSKRFCRTEISSSEHIVQTHVDYGRLPPGYKQFLWSKMKLVIKMCIEGNKFNSYKFAKSGIGLINFNDKYLGLA